MSADIASPGQAGTLVIILGVSGSGKTTVGREVARHFGAKFIDADDLHPAKNVAKMSAGTPLEDADRAPWLDAVHHRLDLELQSGASIILACSALKRRYRERLAGGLDHARRIVWVYLRGDYETIRQRLEERSDHFMGAKLLRSQFDALEEPDDALVLDIERPIEALAAEIIEETSRG